MFKKYLFAIILFLFSTFSFSKTNQNPKLIVYVVYDQLRADLILRYKNEFKSPFGFSFLMNKGAYVPFGQYEVSQCMTCPGHAMISSGAWPAHMGISQNEWFSSKEKKEIYCAEDSEYGVSPRRLGTTTVSDEWKMTHPKSKVVSLALKDRAAIMLGGHRADTVYWIDELKGQWSTSPYYSSKLPDWVNKKNEELKIKPLSKNEWSRHPGVKTTVDLAIEALKNERLGQSDQTDFLMLSFSSHDMLGHAFGPNSKDIHELIVQEDQELSRFISEIKNKLSLDNVWIVLTADHGIPPTVEDTQKAKFSAGLIDEIQIFQKVYQKLNEVFKSDEKIDWFRATRLFHYYVNWEKIDLKKYDKKEILKVARQVLLEMPFVEEVYAPDLDGEMKLAPRFEKQIKNSLVKDQWGDLFLIPKPYSYAKGNVTVNHVTGYSYDKMVPMIFFGGPFKTGIYRNPIYVVDIHTTLAALLEIIPGPKADGRVLSELIK